MAVYEAAAVKAYGYGKEVMMSMRLYQEIAESIRQAIFHGEFKAGDKLPSVRALSAEWNCAPGTVREAYQALARQGLVIGRSGRGTYVAAAISSMVESPFRQAVLANETEAFLLRVFSNGYSPKEVEQVIQSALDRWQTMPQKT